MTARAVAGDAGIGIDQAKRVVRAKAVREKVQKATVLTDGSDARENTVATGVGATRRGGAMRARAITTATSSTRTTKAPEASAGANASRSAKSTAPPRRQAASSEPQLRAPRKAAGATGAGDDAHGTALAAVPSTDGTAHHKARGTNPMTLSRATGRDAADRLSPVNPARISDTIVEQIRALIRQGHLQPGDRLPNERTLCERFGVSRVSVRDALRILEASGLIEIRVGARGGAFLTAPSAAGVGARLSDMLTMSSLSAQAVTEARVVVELGILDLICARADETDLAELTEICERSSAAVDAGTYSMDLSVEFHVRLARAAHNQAIDLIVASFQEALRMSLFEARSVAPLMGVAGTDEHWELVEALRRRDGSRAREVMTVHLARTTARLHSSTPSRPTLPLL